jgi:hypothetical protein
MLVQVTAADVFGPRRLLLSRRRCARSGPERRDAPSLRLPAGVGEGVTYGLAQQHVQLQAAQSPAASGRRRRTRPHARTPRRRFEPRGAGRVPQAGRVRIFSVAVVHLLLLLVPRAVPAARRFSKRGGHMRSTQPQPRLLASCTQGPRPLGTGGPGPAPARPRPRRPPSPAQRPARPPRASPARPAMLSHPTPPPTRWAGRAPRT